MVTILFAFHVSRYGGFFSNLKQVGMEFHVGSETWPQKFMHDFGVVNNLVPVFFQCTKNTGQWSLGMRLVVYDFMNSSR